MIEFISDGLYDSNYIFSPDKDRRKGNKSFRRSDCKTETTSANTYEIRFFHVFRCLSFHDSRWLKTQNVCDCIASCIIWLSETILSLIFFHCKWSPQKKDTCHRIKMKFFYNLNVSHWHGKVRTSLLR